MKKLLRWTPWVACFVVGAGQVDAQSTRCTFRGAPEALAERPSPLDSVTFSLGGQEAKLCYGRPSARGRVMLGGQEPFGLPWRLGADEPTTIHLPFPASVGTVSVDPGSYSLYAIPQEHSWTVVVNANVHRWGIPLSPDVRQSDLGSFSVVTAPLQDHVETLTFRFDPAAGQTGALVYEWEHTTFRIPVARR
ncbi:MAG: DUF2911 domain-containing protein [Gemmatimonadota bacterium]|nr:DUF2911 domain-containing protein [Gemmatimonadota bacterium]